MNKLLKMFTMYALSAFVLMGCETEQANQLDKNYGVYLSSRINASLAKYIKSIEGENLILTIRSSGGNTAQAVDLGIYLLDKNLTVEVHDFCHSACAEFILPAADQIRFIDSPLIGFHWSPIMDYNQYLDSGTDMSVCEFEGLADHKTLLNKRGLNVDFWKEAEDRLVLTEFKLRNIGEPCPWKSRKFENLFWLPTSQQFRKMWGLNFDGYVCADNFSACKAKIDLHWSKGKRIVVGDEIYISKGRQ